MSTRKALSAAVALSAALILTAVPAAATTPPTTTVATDVAALKAAETKLVSVLGSYAPTPAWTAQYIASEATVKTAQAALTLALAQATPPKPLAWHKVETNTVTSTNIRGIYIGDESTPGYYTGQFKATVSVSLPPKHTPGPPTAGVMGIYWQVSCISIYGLTGVTKNGFVIVTGTTGSANMVIPPHMRDCTAEASFSANPWVTGTATRIWSATLALFVSGKQVNETGYT